jgi:hypothetical protein
VHPPLPFVAPTGGVRGEITAGQSARSKFEVTFVRVRDRLRGYDVLSRLVDRTHGQHLTMVRGEAGGDVRVADARRGALAQPSLLRRQPGGDVRKLTREPKPVGSDRIVNRWGKRCGPFTGFAQRPSRQGLCERSLRPPNLARREPKNDRAACRCDRPVIRGQRGRREPWHTLGAGARANQRDRRYNETGDPATRREVLHLFYGNGGRARMMANRHDLA